MEAVVLDEFGAASLRVRACGVCYLLPLRDAASAHSRLEQRQVAGRLVLSPDVA